VVTTDKSCFFYTPTYEGDNPCPRRYKTTTKFNQAVGVYVNPTLPKHKAQILTTQPRLFNLSFF